MMEGPDIAEGTIVTFTPDTTATEATGEELSALIDQTVAAMRSRLLALDIPKRHPAA
jgi:hypothetical protein